MILLCDSVLVFECTTSQQKCNRRKTKSRKPLMKNGLQIKLPEAFSIQTGYSSSKVHTPPSSYVNVARTIFIRGMPLPQRLSRRCRVPRSPVFGKKSRVITNH